MLGKETISTRSFGIVLLFGLFDFYATLSINTIDFRIVITIHRDINIDFSSFPVIAKMALLYSNCGKSCPGI